MTDWLGLALLVLAASAAPVGMAAGFFLRWRAAEAECARLRKRVAALPPTPAEQARIEAAAALRADALNGAKQGYDGWARSKLEAADEIERGL